mgnify:CR=1 FL=1
MAHLSTDIVRNFSAYTQEKGLPIIQSPTPLSTTRTSLRVGRFQLFRIPSYFLHTSFIFLHISPAFQHLGPNRGGEGTDFKRGGSQISYLLQDFSKSHGGLWLVKIFYRSLLLVAISQKPWLRKVMSPWPHSTPIIRDVSVMQILFSISLTFPDFEIPSLFQR